MVYAIWDVATANLVGAYDTEQEALADVRDTVSRFGREYVCAWALDREGEGSDDIGEAIAEGEDLIDRAFRSVAAG
jgi:hypothetical protein